MNKTKPNLEYKRAGDSEYVRPKRRNIAKPSEAKNHAVIPDVTISNQYSVLDVNDMDTTANSENNITTENNTLYCTATR